MAQCVPTLYILIKNEAIETYTPYDLNSSRPRKATIGSLRKLRRQRRRERHQTKGLMS